MLEFGAGASSVVLASALSRHGGGKLTSIEQMPDWCAREWRHARGFSRVDIRMIVASPRQCVSHLGLTAMFQDARQALEERSPFDLVLIDAPQWYYGRDGALPLVHRLLAPGAWLVLDDAGRPAERQTIGRWLRTYPDLKLAAFDPAYGRNGVAVFRLTGGSGPRICPSSVIETLRESIRLFGVRRNFGPGVDMGR